MASITVVRSAIVALVCIALVQAIKAEDSSDSSTEQTLPSSNVQTHYNITSEEECNCVCGVSRNVRIVGGSRAGRAEFPWLAAMYLRNKYYCGGSLITERHILTAAHCFHRIRYSEVTVTLGTYDINDKTEKPLKRNVKRVTTHPDFKIATFDSDVAIVELDKPVSFGSWNVGTGCLPTEEYNDYDGGLNGTVIGRGRTKENGQVSGIPRKVDVPLMSMQQCRDAGYAKHRITENMLCAGYPSGAKDACQGDSGGPLHLHLNNTTMSTSEIVGVVSWGRGCARPNFPGVYTRIQKFLPWIRSNLKGGCECTRQ